MSDYGLHWGKAFCPVPAVGRQCRPQNLNRGCARQWEVTYGPSVFQMSEFYANFCKDACEKQKKPNTAIFFVIPCNKRWRDVKADIFSAPLLYVFLFLKRFPDATCNWAEIWKLFIWTHCGTFLSEQRNKTNENSYFTKVECVFLIYRDCIDLQNMVQPLLSKGHLSNRNVNSIECRTQRPGQRHCLL